MGVAIAVTTAVVCALISGIITMTSERDWEIPIMATLVSSMAGTIVAAATA